MKKLLLTTLMAASLALPAAFGQRIPEREKKQQERIDQGTKSGELTKKEKARIEAKERKLKREVRRDRKDGPGLTAKERVKIEHQQDKLSQDIYKQKHD